MMMTRRILLIATLCAAAVSGPAFGASVADDVTAQLRAQGYTIASVGRTLLGRTRIVAVKNGQEREIILNGQTGEILRDFLKRRSSDDDEQRILIPDDDDSGGSDSGSGDDNGSDGDGGSSGSGGGDDHDDDSGDDDSGHGGDDDGSDDSSDGDGGDGDDGKD